jgi:hypothetical protein
MIELSGAAILTIIGLALTVIGLAGRALWILANKLGDIAGELKSIGVLLKKGEEQFASIGRTQKEHSDKISDHETRITVLET